MIPPIRVSTRDQKNIENRGGPIVVEPLVVVSEHLAQWVRPAIELSELQRLRQEGLTVRELMERFGVSRTTIKERLRALKRGTE